MIKILLGGSPCIFWSIAQTTYRETEAAGTGWELFRNYLIAKEKFKPDIFLYENNKSVAKPIKEQIKNELHVPDEASYIEIDSALVSAQSRKRFYVHNCGNVGQPKDRDVMLADIVEDDVQPIVLHNLYGGFKETKPRVFEGKSPTIRTSCGGGHLPRFLLKGHDLSDISSLKEARELSRQITVKEGCRLQTLPDNYCDGVSYTRAFAGIGNGWTAEVIIHILNGALKDVPRDEELVVLSMYDGIGTGRYCLDKMGFTNVTYRAYEIDEYAIQIAKNNYADIVECGDAFAVREEGWKYGTD